MLLLPNAKINIGLQIVSKRADGYHELQTLFYPLRQLTDRLDIERSETFSFESKGLPTDCPEGDNLVVKTYERFRQQYGIGAVSIVLNKLIPTGAGLGGGSADATFTAIALNELFELHLSTDDIVNMVRPLGADCAFFAYNTCCYACGIGDRLTTYPLSLKGYTLAVVKPNVHVSTAQAYSHVTPRPPLFELRELNTLKPEQWNGKVTNDFEDSVFKQFPMISEVREQLIAEGAVYAAMSGSGAAVFALFEKKGNLHAAIMRHRLTHLFKHCFLHTEDGI